MYQTHIDYTKISKAIETTLTTLNNHMEPSFQRAVMDLNYAKEELANALAFELLGKKDWNY
ncbi:hypothetical protein JOC86_000830 [Bacillus pakistanensis]|uniref:Uncharacterized protein n=1 Tax=Rossellomorea pakistanensis TaxID=992288 RepID=A0ABS2N8Y0_9BACI|nr:hypothetical protein [Bacillus pakistanensis]MBM7584293.1 hypothetical protein [Bacillus pakistanensis]